MTPAANQAAKRDAGKLRKSVKTPKTVDGTRG